MNFIDTNVLVYSFDETQPVKRDVARRVVREALENGDVISFQVVQEALNVVGRLFAIPMRREDLQLFLEHVLQPLWKVQPTASLYSRALDLSARLGFSFYDSVIVAAALESGCDTLLSEDLQAGQVIEHLRIVNPFA